MQLGAARLLAGILALATLWHTATAAAPSQAVIIGTSRFWFNYRHTANALGVYHHVKRWLQSLMLDPLGPQAGPVTRLLLHTQDGCHR